MRKSPWLVCLMTLAAGASTAYGQIPGLDVHLAARVGYFTPLGIVGEDASDRETKLSEGLGFGANIEFDIPASPINVRANIDATFGRSLEVEGLEVPGTDVDLIAFTGDLVFRPVPRLVLAQPYILAGAGFKRYTSEGAFDDQTNFTGHLGIGADMNLTGLSLLVEVSDYISSLEPVDGSDSRLQNDVFITVGLRVKLF